MFNSQFHRTTRLRAPEVYHWENTLQPASIAFYLTIPFGIVFHELQRLGQGYQAQIPRRER